MFPSQLASLACTQQPGAHISSKPSTPPEAVPRDVPTHEPSNGQLVTNTNTNFMLSFGFLQGSGSLKGWLREGVGRVKSIESRANRPWQREPQCSCSWGQVRARLQTRMQLPSVLSQQAPRI
jgi:hypothetical protein